MRVVRTTQSPEFCMVLRDSPHSCTLSKLSYLPARLGAHSEAEEGGGGGVPLHLELSKRCSVALNGLGHLPVHRVQLHGPHHTVLLHMEQYKKKKSENDETRESERNVYCLVIQEARLTRATHRDYRKIESFRGWKRVGDH